MCVRLHRGPLSKYQFETAAGIGMRHTFHRPLWPAFHFYLYLPPPRAPAPAAILYPSLSAHPLQRAGNERRIEGRETVRSAPRPIFYDILFPIRGRRCRGIIGAGPYSTFMALNRDEVSVEWLFLQTFTFFFLLSPPSDRTADLHAILPGVWNMGGLSRGESLLLDRFSCSRLLPTLVYVRFGKKALNSVALSATNIPSL